MSKAQVMTVAVLLIFAEAILPVPGPLTLVSVYVLIARPNWFKSAVECLYAG